MARVHQPWFWRATFEMHKLLLLTFFLNSLGSCPKERLQQGALKKLRHWPNQWIHFLLQMDPWI